MMLSEQGYVHTVHPNDRICVKMKCEHYKQITEFILNILQEEADVTILTLIEKAHFYFGDQFKGETAWYVYGVKLDLETRGILKNKRCEKKKMNYIVKSRRMKTRKFAYPL